MVMKKRKIYKTYAVLINRKTGKRVGGRYLIETYGKNKTDAIKNAKAYHRKFKRNAIRMKEKHYGRYILPKRKKSR